MGESLQVQLFSAFLGTEEGIRGALLPEIFSSSGSKNLLMDTLGRARKLSGYAKRNSSAVTTTGGASTTRVKGLFPYRKTTSGIISRQLIGVFDDEVDEWELKYSLNDGSTWTDIADLGYLSANAVPDFAQYGDDLFITNGVMSPRKWSGAALSTAGATQSPTPTGVANGNAGLLSGSYRYKIVSVETDADKAPGSVTSAVVPVSAGQIDLSWTADSNTDVIGYEVYRTTGAGSVLYFVSFVQGRTAVSFTDNSADTVIFANRALQEHGDAPSTTHFVEPHKGRMWWGRSAEHPLRAWWSDPGDADSVYIENYLDFSDNAIQGDVMTGMVGNFGEQLVVFTEKSLWTVSGTGALLDYITDWNKDRKNTQTGSVSHRSVVRVPSGARYINQSGDINTISTKAMAYFTPLGDIRLFDGISDTIISHPVKDTLQSFTYSARQKVHAVHDSKRNQFVWFFPVDGHSECRKAVSWNYKWGVWYVWTPQPFSCSTESENSTEAAFVLVGEAERSKGGYVYKLFEGTSFDGSAINAIWFTKTLRGVINIKDDLAEAMSYTKRFRWVDLLFSAETNVSILVEWLDAEESDTGTVISSETIGPDTLGILTASGGTLVSASGEPLVAIKPITQKKILLKHSDGRYPHGEGIRLRISDNSSTGGWALEALSIAYQLLEGMKRRSP